MKQWFPLVLWHSFFLFIPYFGWSLFPCCVDPDVPGYHWTDASMYLSLATSSKVCGMCLLNPAAVQRDNCGMLPTSYFLSELQFSPLPTGGWDSSVQTLSAGHGSVSPESHAVGLWMNNIGMEGEEMESQCLRLFFLCIFTGLSKIAPLLPPSNVVII